MYSNKHVYRESDTAVTSFPHTSDGVQIVGGNPLNTMFAHIHVKAAANASGTTVVTIDVMHSSDGSTWKECTSGEAYTFNLSTTAQELVFSLPFTTDKDHTAIRVSTSGGTSPTLKYNAFQALERLV
jgi:hypothetical protein